MRLIDADALMTWFDNHYDDEEMQVGYVSGIIREHPTIEAVPVVHGHWKKHRMMSMYDNCSETWHKCSECEYDTRHDTPYCPMCGARMDEVTE